MSLREESGVPAGSRMIDACGVRLAVSCEGSGPPVVCLHAIGHGGRDFEQFSALVREHFQVIRLDWPGQGRSQPDTQLPTAARYAELLADVLAPMRLISPIIVGNSIGGAAAIRYAASNRVRALVLCNPGGLVPINPLVTGVCNAFSAFFAQGARGAWWFPRLFAWYYRLLILPSAEATAQRERIIRAGREIAPVLRDGWKQFGGRSSDIRDLAISLDLPVLFAWARRDRIISLGKSMSCIERMKAARVATFDAGHAAFLERPGEFVGEFLRFADSLPRLASSSASSGLPTAFL